LDGRRYMAVREVVGVRERTFADGRLDCGYLCLDLLFGTRMLRSLGNNYDLAELTEADLEATASGFPARYWATGEPLGEL
jgi:hypothetical protein